MRTHRRGKFLSGTASTLGAFAIVAGPARAAQFEYKSAHQLNLEVPMHVRETQLWEQVAKETNGRLVVKVFPQGTLGGQAGLFSQLRLNAIQFISIGNGVYSDVVPVAAIDSVGFAFKDEKTPWNVMTGALGDYVRSEFEAKGLYIPKGGLFDLGLRQITSATHPIRTVEDFTGFKLRVVLARINVDLFRTLGASPVGMDQAEVPTALQTHILDGQETPFNQILSNRYYETQKYLSVTNHMWTGEWYVANLQAWKALPSDIQAIVQRNIAKYCLLARDDALRQNIAAAEKLRRLGFIFNTADSQPMRARLAPYYGRWKNEFGPKVWGLLEDGVGKLT